MNPLRYVVASLPRSGTKYISTVLSKIGLMCGHEKCFGPTRTRESQEFLGDASWMVVPSIKNLPSGTIVFHQLRDPIKVLNSNLPPGGDSNFRTWNENAGLPSDPLYGKHIPWKRFIWENTLDWVWPSGGSEKPESPEEIQRLIHWWMNWNLWIEHASLCRSDLTYIRYKLEDMNPMLLDNIAAVIDPSAYSPASSRRPPTLDQCESVLGDVSTTLNRHRTPNNRITVDDMPAPAQMLMFRYGYYADLRIKLPDDTAEDITV